MNLHLPNSIDSSTPLRTKSVHSLSYYSDKLDFNELVSLSSSSILDLTFFISVNAFLSAPLYPFLRHMASLFFSSSYWCANDSFCLRLAFIFFFMISFFFAFSLSSAFRRSSKILLFWFSGIQSIDLNRISEVIVTSKLDLSYLLAINRNFLCYGWVNRWQSCCRYLKQFSYCYRMILLCFHTPCC